MYLILKDKISVVREVNIKGERWILSKKSWERKECDGCKFHNPEYQMGVCSIYICQKKKEVITENEVHDTS